MNSFSPRNVGALPLPMNSSGITRRKIAQVVAQRLRHAGALATTSLALLACAGAFHTHARAQAPTIPDVAVTAVDKDGEEQVRFYTDLIKGKKVIISVMYTECTTTCSTFAKELENEMKRVDGKFGRDVFFVTISIDPMNDDPGKLKTWANRFSAREGWTFVTANAAQLENLQSVLRWLRFPTTRVMHAPSILVLDDPRGVWQYTYAFRPDLSTFIDRVLGL